MQADQKKISIPDIILLASIVLVGGFHEYISCALAIAQSVYLLLRLRKAKTLRLRSGFWSLSMGFLCAFYGLSCIWAVDRGMAFVGFLKFLPVGLYLLCIWQEENGKTVLSWLPYAGAVSAVISAVGMQFSAAERYFAVAGRLAGFFQYPNTFAIFLLVCELLLVKKSGKKLWDYITLVVLVVSILYTGSRTAFVVAILANGAMLLAVAGKKLRLALLVAALLCLGTVLLLGTNENSVLHRYLSISLVESTFVGRILYYVDALQLLLKYPLGMGYMGYYYTQGSVQTGVYSVVYIHNDFYQFLLDIGWIPGCMLLAAVVSRLLKKSVPVADKIIVGAVCLHSLFDFNLQFICVFMILALLMDDESAGWIQLKKPAWLKVAAVACIGVCLYMGTALALAHWGAWEVADALYPFNTRNKITMLEHEEDLDRANVLAEQMLKQNKHYYPAYSIKAKYSYRNGDFGSLIRYKNQIFQLQPFAHTEYEEYCQMLINGIALYEKAGNPASAEICRKELIATQQKLQQTAQRLSTLGKMINDQPVTELSQEITAYIREMGE